MTVARFPEARPVAPSGRALATYDVSTALAPQPHVRRRRPRAVRARRPAASPRQILRAPSAPIVVTVLVVVSGVVPSSGLRSLSGPMPSGAQLVAPTTYAALSPLCRALDALSLLSTAQHAALVATVLGLAVLSGVRAARGTLRPRWSAARNGVSRAGLSLGGLAALYLAAALLPRPALPLAVADPDVVRVDFHSHTSASRTTCRAGSRRRGAASGRARRGTTWSSCPTTSSSPAPRRRWRRTRDAPATVSSLRRRSRRGSRACTSCSSA
jgi:hypothetical protein